MSFHAPIDLMVKHPILGMGEGNNGFFSFKKNNIRFYCQSSDGEGWEHVSVSLSVKRCPDWEEMCMIKNMFWDDEDCVVQYHPPKSDWVSMHQFCLHLWRPVEGDVKRPPSIMVGLK